MKERETNEERQTRLVNLCHHLHILVMALHINWLGEERMKELDVQRSEKARPWEGVFPVSISITLFMQYTSYRNLYAITHTDYTQYINT